MADFKIPCAVFARLAKIHDVLAEDADPWYRTIRIENNIAIASSRNTVIIERIADNDGICHIVADPVLIKQCEAESKFDSLLHVSTNDALKYASAKTTFGYNFPANACYWSNTPNDLDRWKKVVGKAGAKVSKGGMFWRTDVIAALAASSPSGCLVFAEQIDTSVPTVIRDLYDEKWFAVFRPSNDAVPYSPATVPEWFK